MSDSTLNSDGQGGGSSPYTPRVVIVGGGFGGLAAANALRKATAQLILIDRTNRWKTDPPTHRRKKQRETVSLFRQRQHGCGRQRLRRFGKRQITSAWTDRVASVGVHSHYFPGPAQSEDQCVFAMSLVVPDRLTRFASHRELSAI
jgi:2-polyprenyl-6-methoxyphenol hydroxylase-like FAD-dependent oxidoreductase